jgi:hypothetical protein
MMHPRAKRRKEIETGDPLNPKVPLSLLLSLLILTALSCETEHRRCRQTVEQNERERRFLHQMRKDDFLSEKEEEGM